MIKFQSGDHKNCKSCLMLLPLNEFHKKCDTGDGLCTICRTCKYKKNKKYYSSPAGKLAVSGQTKRKWLRTKQRISARNLLNRAIQDKKIEAKPCAVCNSKELIEAHHEDYSKPYEVRWLCKRHHMELHGKRLAKKESEYDKI